MIALTVRQQEILAWVRGFMAREGYAPTLREIGLGCGIRSTNGVNDHLTALEKKGFLRRDGNKSRAMVLTDKVT